MTQALAKLERPALTEATGVPDKAISDVDLTDWVGRQEKTVGCLPPVVAQTVHATLASHYPRAPEAGEPMPPLWHWYAFPPTAATDDLGPDGHPRLGGFLPPVPYERRMWAGGRLQFFNDLVVGESIEKSSTILSVEQKCGSASGMVFVDVEHEISGAAGLAVREIQTLVYLPVPTEFSPPPKKNGPVEDLTFDVVQAVSSALLFRYSAITFNAHRIHYDMLYAKEVEHYPGLVVHGPLQATLLMANAARCRGRRPDTFNFRGVHPMFHDSDLHLRGQATPRGLELFTVAAAGHIGMSAKAEWEN